VKDYVGLKQQLPCPQRGSQQRLAQVTSAKLTTGSSVLPGVVTW
jgi:hypothetical protein